MDRDIIFPDPRLSEDDGLVAVGGELSTDYLLAAYSQGIFPWFNEGEPVLWWSPNPRMVLYPKDFRISKTLQKTLHSNLYFVDVDKNFREVITQCSSVARKNQSGTWISGDIIEAYTKLHELGYAHSFETYKEGDLVGGLYGISLGNAFFGESMFYRERDASKVALAKLNKLMLEWGYAFIDVQQSTDHLRSLGAVDISRNRFLEELKIALTFPTLKEKWTL